MLKGDLERQMNKREKQHFRGKNHLENEHQIQSMFRDRWNKVEEIIHNEMIKTYNVNIISKSDIEDIEYPAYV